MTEAEEQRRIEGVPADRSRVRLGLEDGGRLVATVRSRKSKKHVTVRLVAKQLAEGGGYVSRATLAGRVGMADADAVFVEDPGLAWDENMLGTFLPATGEWKPARGADPARVWAGYAVLRYALGVLDLEEQAEVFVACECTFCGRRLEDPESITRGVGPECFGRSTRSRPAERMEV